MTRAECGNHRFWWIPCTADITHCLVYTHEIRPVNHRFSKNVIRTQLVIFLLHYNKGWPQLYSGFTAFKGGSVFPLRLSVPAFRPHDPESQPELPTAVW